MDISVAVCGAGTMGSGIALVCARNGMDVKLFDISKEALEHAQNIIGKNLQYLLTRKKITSKEETEILSRIQFIDDINECTAFVIIEAIAEKMEAKAALFQKLAEINNEEVIFASNTSSLSITELQNRIPFPDRVAGMHFFNPPYIMPLVEIVKGEKTDNTIVEELVSITTQLKKQPVVCRDSPGFIVNRIARPYYLESLRLLESGVASFEDIDNILESTGFKMGPFRLMDLIGLDINLATSEIVYEALGRPERLKPSEIQKDKVAKGELGKKSGKGFYQY